MAKICAVEDCSRKHHAHGYCAMHAARLRRTGSPTETLRETTLGSFWKRVKKTDSCWWWTGERTKQGYGMLATRIRPTASRSKLAHRVSWELENGAIPDGHYIDHLCRNESCVNPSHLEPVTPKENVRRGLHGVLRTHCKYGHELTEENTWYEAKTNCRRCKKCASESARRSTLRNRVGNEAYNKSRRKPCKRCGGEKQAGDVHLCTKCKMQYAVAGRGEGA